MSNKTLSLRCPICKKIVLDSEPEFPFCSERCRTIDLGKWASGGYVISTPISDPEDLMNAAAAEERTPQAMEREEQPRNPNEHKIQ